MQLENYKIEIDFKTGNLIIAPMKVTKNVTEIYLQLHLTRTDGESLEQHFSELGSAKEVNGTGRLQVNNADLEFFERDISIPRF